MYSMTKLALEGTLEPLEELEKAGLHPDLTYRLLYRKEGDEFVIIHPFGEVRLRKDSDLKGLVDEMNISHLTSLRKVANLPLAEAIGLYSEPFRLQSVMEFWLNQRNSAGQGFNEALASAWLSSRHLNMPAILPWTGGDEGVFDVEDLMELFKDNAIVTNDGDIEVPAERITVFSAGWPSTISWYPSPEEAMAHLPEDMDDGSITLFSAIVPPTAILAIFRLAATNEYIVDPSLITIV